MNGKLVLIDGHSILNRAFYGVPELTNSQGLHTNAVYGFLNILFKILEEEKPEYLAVAFDVKAPTFRHEIYKEYKGTRKPMPQELHEQVPVIKEMLTAMQVPILEKPGLEADDILGTLAKRAESEGMEVSLVSGDRDLLQIATDHIKIRIPKTKGGKTEIEDYYAADVEASYGVDPLQFIDLKALMGDSADNIPGVPKVGKKTAEELMKTYGSLDNIYAHAEEITKKSIRESLMENKNLAYLSQTLATINVNSEIALSWEDALMGNLFTPEAYTVCKKLEFKNMLSRFEEDTAPKNNQSEYFMMTSELTEAEEIFGKAKEAERVAFYILEDLPEEKDFCGLALCLSEKDVYILIKNGFLTKDYLCSKLAELAETGKEMSTFDIKGKYDYLGSLEKRKAALLGKEKLSQDETLMKADSIRCATKDYADVLIGAYLLNPLKSDYQLEDIASEHLDLLIPSRAQAFEKRSLCKALEEKEEAFKNYAGFCAYVCFMAVPVLSEKLKESGMAELFTEMEMPLSRVLHEMEKEGVQVQREELLAYGEALTGRISQLEASIHEKAGCNFNINSPKQLGEVLFDQMGLKGGKKTKTGYSTAADILEKLAPDYPIVAEILEYRALTKLKSTYADGLADYISEDGRIHTNLNQTITATGRISSTEPNLQNIPMRTQLGRLIRKVFVPKEGFIFTDADYSQIELRVLAHFSDDAQLIEAYRSDADIHRITASKVFHTPFEEVTDLQRRNAKAVNFGIVYGISSFGLSQDLSISVKEAKEYIEQYFMTYPGVKEFLDRVVGQAKEQGYTETMFGRRRPVPELKSSNFMQRSFGERVAMNAPIQGTAADIIKLAMVHVWEELRERGLKSRLILQIHDELLIETAENEAEEVKQLLTEQMKAAAALAVALEVDVHTGKNWYEAK